MNILPHVWVETPSEKLLEVCEILKERGYVFLTERPVWKKYCGAIVGYYEQDFTVYFNKDLPREEAQIYLLYRFPIDEMDELPLERYFDSLFRTGKAGFPREHGLLRHLVEKTDDGVVQIEPMFRCGNENTLPESE